MTPADKFIEDQRLRYHLGNAVKYICRAGRKDPSKVIEDLEKSRRYLDRKIERLKAVRDKRSLAQTEMICGMKADNARLREALDGLFQATLNDMTARGLPYEWSDDSAMAKADDILIQY